MWGGLQSARDFSPAMIQFKAARGGRPPGATRMDNQTPSPSRRAFLGAMTAASYTRVMGANEKVRIGFIGCGLIGLRHIADFKKLPEGDLLAVPDVYDARIDRAKSDIGTPGVK